MYTLSMEVTQMTNAIQTDNLQHCNRCRKDVDGNTAHKEQGTMRFRGKAVKVTDFYCDACAAVRQSTSISEFELGGGAEE